MLNCSKKYYLDQFHDSEKAVSRSSGFCGTKVENHCRRDLNVLSLLKLLKGIKIAKCTLYMCSSLNLPLIHLKGISLLADV